MAKLNYSVQSETVLVLQETGQIGDTIDLKDEQKIDSNSLSKAVQDSIDQRIKDEKAAWEKSQSALIDSQVQKEKEAAKFSVEQAKQLAKEDAQKERDRLQEELLQLKADLAASKKQNESEQALALERQRAEFLAKQQAEKEAASEQSQSLERQLLELKNQVDNQERDRELALSKTKSDYEAQLKAAHDQVEFYKDFKARQSTKEIGESLEVYAHQEFDKIRPYAFPNAYFEKDNEVSKETGSKGDFIFRDYDDGLEFISIMFDMKNEADTTEKKHKNSDFFKELDKDRKEKGTEYAVLVSLLESDSDLYNTGIVQVHEYEKMYVIRPQFFVHFIGLLRNAALDSVQYKKQLQEERNQNIDITNFEENINSFKDKFAKNYQSYSKNFQAAIDEIDKAIKRMEEVKRKLTTSENQLRLANNKLDDVSVKKLTHDNPTMQAKFDELKKERD
ncbi:DUF2130 domain-containing protein [Fructobacillus sp. M158]|uniref:DUF2130 domain-containing protein n=1 Tax=Fructobacillus parabroussonetiae TaxID=2713174 RepID=UPI00200A7628|nr:DUF2130 domain-containing protein [Fructobacillus parabroussonetiae]MCK8616972.1 DUF2130 domain-containing protein [Fructobacillus parabroussonetiae]